MLYFRTPQYNYYVTLCIILHLYCRVLLNYNIEIIILMLLSVYVAYSRHVLDMFDALWI